MGKTQQLGTLVNGFAVDANGNVGIGGAASASYKLDVTGTIRATGSIFGDVGFRTKSLNGYLLKNDADNANLGGLTRRSYWAGGAALDTQIFAETGYGIFLNVNGSSSTGMVINSSGNVGIGTSSPSYRLDVATTATNSVFAATTTFTHTGGYLDHSAFLAPNMTGGALSVSFGKSASNYNTGKFVFNYAGDGSTSNSVGLGFYNADNLLVVRANGHIGIGTTSPAAQLHMYNGGSTVRLRMESGSTQAALLDFYNSTTARWSIGIDNTQSYGKLENRVLATDAIRFYDSTNNVVLVPSSGNVGIGTSSPAKPLHVYSTNTNANAQLKLTNSGTTPSGYLGMFSNTFYINSGGTYDSGWSLDGSVGVAAVELYSFNGGSQINFATAASNTTPTERMRITSGGNIGIGLTNPGHKVEIWNTTHNVLRVVNTGSANGNSPTAQFLNSYGNHSWGITAEFRVGASGGEDRPSILFSNGFDNNTWACGFGYADSSYFRINRDQGPYSGSWGVTLFSLDRSGNYSFSGSNVSDRRNKKDIVYISDSQLDTILKLRPATFVKKSPGKEEYSEHTHTGFIAQDILEDNIPNLVHGSEEKGYGLDYDGILALAVKAIQELKAEIDILKNK